MNTNSIALHWERPSSLASRGIARSADPGGRSTFSSNLLAVTEPAESPSGSTGPSRSAGRTERTDGPAPSSRAFEVQAAVQPPRADAAAAASPFGRAAESRPVVDVGTMDEWTAYFRTHAPGEWVFNAHTREKFAEIYGPRALVTLDWTFTVPENMDPVWVTRVPLDSTGKPLPRHADAKET